MKKKITGANTKLERTVQAEINRHAPDYDDGAEGFIRDLSYGGCESGIVGSLIYYKDTLTFYKKHKTEIHELLSEILDSTGYDSPSLLFGDKWDKHDIFANDAQNENLLSWFGFEETARFLADKNNIEV